MHAGLQREAQRTADVAGVDWPAALQEHQRWLRTVLFSRLRELDAVDEVFQEVGLAAAKQSATGTSPDRVAPWLYRVAVRQAMLYRRRCGRQRKLTRRFVEDRPPVQQDTSVPDPLQWLLAEERNVVLRSAMERLAQRDAEILMLKYAEGWSYRQISEHLGISESAVEARLHRARRRLRAQMKDY